MDPCELEQNQAFRLQRCSCRDQLMGFLCLQTGCRRSWILTSSKSRWCRREGAVGWRKNVGGPTRVSNYPQRCASVFHFIPVRMLTSYTGHYKGNPFSRENRGTWICVVTNIPKRPEKSWTAATKTTSSNGSTSQRKHLQGSTNEE